MSIFKKIKNKECATLVALPFALKSIVRPKEEELWKTQKYFTMQKSKSSKNPFKENQNPSRYYYN
jgi:hypothetical protein